MSNGSGSRVMHKKTRTIKFSAKLMSKFVAPCIDSETDENSRSHRHEVQVGQNIQVRVHTKVKLVKSVKNYCFDLLHELHKTESR